MTNQMTGNATLPRFQPQTPPDAPLPPNKPSSRNRLVLLAAIALIGLGALGAVAWSYLRADAPANADLATAAAEAAAAGADAGGDSVAAAPEVADNAEAATDGYGYGTDTNQAPEAAEGTATPAGDIAVGSLSGVWSVDTSIGAFSFENSTGTFVGFRVGEELTTIGETEAVGRTPAVSGAVSIDGSTATGVEIVADMTAITTDISQRDGATRRTLDTDNFPTASFVATQAIDLGPDPASGQPIQVTAVGDLTIHGVTNPVEVAIEAQLVGDTIVIVGSTDVVFADYGISTPSAPVVARLDDFGVIEFQLFLTKS